MAKKEVARKIGKIKRGYKTRFRKSLPVYSKSPGKGLRRELCKMTMSRKTKAGGLSMIYNFIIVPCFRIVKLINGFKLTIKRKAEK